MAQNIIISYHSQELGQLSSQHVTVLFLVMDTAERSITEMRVADFSGGVCTFHPYMQSFPFQLYALVKNALSLPASVAEAVRQWFEFNVRTRSA
jgi:midasin